MAALLSVIQGAGASGNSRGDIVTDFRGLQQPPVGARAPTRITGGDTNIAPFVFARVRGGQLVPVPVPSKSKVDALRSAHRRILTLAAIAAALLAGGLRRARPPRPTTGAGENADDLRQRSAQRPLERQRQGRSQRLAARPGRGPRRVGRYRMTFATLNDATPQRGMWDPGQTTLNAHQAMNDRTDDRLHRRLQLRRQRGLDPAAQPGRDPPGQPRQHRRRADRGRPRGLARGAGEVLPDRPADVRPRDPQRHGSGRRPGQAAAGAGCRKTYVLDDGEVDGSDAAMSFQVAAKAAGLDVLGDQEFLPRATDYTSLAQRSGPDRRRLRARQRDHREQRRSARPSRWRRAAPRAHLSAPPGLAESTFTDPAHGGIPLAVDPRGPDHRRDARARATTRRPDGVLRAYARRYGAWQPDRDLRLRGHEPDARRDRAGHRRRPRPGGALPGPGGDLRHPGPPQRARAPTASTATATRRSTSTGSTGSRDGQTQLLEGDGRAAESALWVLLGVVALLVG